MPARQEIQPIAWLLFIVLTLLWGASFLLIKQSLLVFTPIQLSYLRISASFLFLLPFGIKRFKEIKKKELPYYFIVGFVGSALPSFLFAYAQQAIPSFLAGMLNALTPLWSIIISSLLFKARYDRYKWLALGIGFIGTAILFYQPNDGISLSYYMFWVVLATLSYAVSANVISHKLNHVHTYTISSASFMLIGPFALAMIFNQADILFNTQQDHYWIAFSSMLGLGIFATAIGLILFNRLIHLSNVVFATSITYLIPIIAILLGVFLGEEVSSNQWIGITIILLAVYLVKRK